MSGAWMKMPDVCRVMLNEIEHKRDAAAEALQGFLRGLGYV